MNAKPSISESLNTLLAAEESSPICRWIDSEPYVDARSRRTFETLRRIAATQRQHGGQLSRLILQQSSHVALRRPDPRMAEPHYESISSALPRLKTYIEQLVGRYAAALSQVRDDAAILAAVRGMHDRHTAFLKALETAASSADAGDTHIS